MENTARQLKNASYWAAKIPFNLCIHWLTKLETPEAGIESYGNLSEYPSEAYIAALTEHIALRTSHEILSSVFRRHSVLREVATLFCTSSLAKVLSHFSDEHAAVMIKASQLWHDHEDNALDPYARWKGLPTPKQPRCFDPFAGIKGASMIQIAQSVPWLTRIVMLTGHNELALPHQFKPEDWSEPGTPFLPSAPPSLDTYELFLTHTILPPRFFSLVEPQRLSWTLAHFHEWILGPFFWHEPSSTYSGGFYGVRWITIAIIHIYRVLSRLNEHSQALRVDSPIDPKAELRHLEACATTLASRLIQSINRLLKSLDERIIYGVREGSVSALLDQSMPSAALNFEGSRSTLRIHPSAINEEDDAHWRQMYVTYRGASMDTASLAVTGDSMASLSTLITAALRGDRRDHSITHRFGEWNPNAMPLLADATSTPHTARKTHPRSSDPISPPHKRPRSHSPSPRNERTLPFPLPGYEPSPQSAPPSVVPPPLELLPDGVATPAEPVGLREQTEGRPGQGRFVTRYQKNPSDANAPVKVTSFAGSSRANPEPSGRESAVAETLSISSHVSIESPISHIHPPKEAASIPQAFQQAPNVWGSGDLRGRSSVPRFTQESRSASPIDGAVRSTSAAAQRSSPHLVPSSEQGRANESSYFNMFKRAGESTSGGSTRNASPAAHGVATAPTTRSQSLAAAARFTPSPDVEPAAGSQSGIVQEQSQRPSAATRGRRGRQ